MAHCSSRASWNDRPRKDENTKRTGSVFVLSWRIEDLQVPGCLRIRMRHTKIIATVGPASDSDAMLDALIAAGAGIMRLNFSHGTHDSQAATFARVRAAAKRAGREVAILQDLGG